MNDLKYMRDDLKDTYGILKLQEKILEIMMYIDTFCRQHGITYYLMGGSALGAMRHGGFIPWDDDLDIFMDYANYTKFKACCQQYLDTERFYFQCEDTAELPYFFSKVRMNGTTCLSPVDVKKENYHGGIFVDVMCLNYAAKSMLGKKIQYYAAGMLKAKACSKTNYTAVGIKKEIQLWISKVTVWGPFKKFLLYLVRRHNRKKTDTMAHLFGRAKFANSFYPAELFKGQRFVNFEMCQLAVPSGVEQYLQIRYGDRYMEMPSEETKALYQSHATVWDVNRDYTMYL
ncbi:MAG: LicD family protein [Oscillospiraceae bacterium]|nr:LicD family protein [Oscillospiraceae bacterium]